MRFFSNCDLEYGKTIHVIFRMEGDGILGDGSGMLDPGDEAFGLTYDQIFKELSENGSFEAPQVEHALAA